MSLKQRLDLWVGAGLIEVGQAQRILAHEHQRGRPRLLYAVVGLAGLAIAIGIVSIVASNWDVIPGGAKIAVDLVLVAGLALAVVRLERTGPEWGREVAILVLYGLVLASIALISQVYQLGGEARVALTVWTALTAILMTRARSAFVALIWLAGLQTTYAAWLVWYAERAGTLLDGLALGAVSWAPLLCIVVGRSLSLAAVRRAFAAVFERVGWVEVVLCGTLGSFGFYEGAWQEGRKGLWIGFGVAALVTGRLWVTLARSPHRGSLRVLLVSCLALSFLPILLSPPGLDFFGAITFIGLWLCVAWVAHEHGDARLLNLATAVVGIRILIVYFEVFGSLLGTGIGLVVGGLLTLLLIWLWMRTRRRLDAEEREGAR